MNKGLNFIKLASFLIAIFYSGIQGYACTCADLAVAQQRDNATAVFLGTVVKKKRSDAFEKDGVQVTFKVHRVWKGDVEEELIVYTGATSDLYPFENLCAPPFKVGQKYIVFALGSEKRSTDVCAGTMALSDGHSIIKELGKSRMPERKPRSRSTRRLRESEITTTTGVSGCFRRIPALTESFFQVLCTRAAIL